MNSNIKELGIRNNKSRGQRGSKQQKQILINFMEENINFAHERFEGDSGAQTQQKKWDELTTKLNAAGGARKTADQWKQYWRDLKRNVKTKAAADKRKLEESGVNGLGVLQSQLDEQEKRVVSIMTPAVIDGDGESQEKGLNIPTIAYTDVLNPPTPQTITASGPIELDEPISLEASTPIERRNRPSKRHRISQPRFSLTESHNTMEAYLDVEREKLKLEKEKFEFHKQMELEKRKTSNRKVQALENISNYLFSFIDNR